MAMSVATIDADNAAQMLLNQSYRSNIATFNTVNANVNTIFVLDCPLGEHRLTWSWNDELGPLFSGYVTRVNMSMLTAAPAPFDASLEPCWMFVRRIAKLFVIDMMRRRFPARNVVCSDDSIQTFMQPLQPMTPLVVQQMQRVERGIKVSLSKCAFIDTTRCTVVTNLLDDADVARRANALQHVQGAFGFSSGAYSAGNSIASMFKWKSVPLHYGRATVQLYWRKGTIPNATVGSCILIQTVGPTPKNSFETSLLKNAYLVLMRTILTEHNRECASSVPSCLVVTDDSPLAQEALTRLRWTPLTNANLSANLDAALDEYGKPASSGILINVNNIRGLVGFGHRSGVKRKPVSARQKTSKK
jgi:hypothetical protein